MDVELNTPFKYNQYFNQREKLGKSFLYQSPSKNNNFSSNNNFYQINRLKNDLRENNYNYNYNNINNNNIEDIYKNNIKRDLNFCLYYINYYIEIIKPFSEVEININKLSFDIPLLIYIITILLKSIYSRKFEIIHFCILILLPFGAHIFVNIIIFDEYYKMNILNTNNIFYKKFLKIFFNGIIIFFCGFIITNVFNSLLFQYKIFIHFLYLAYSAFIAKKILVEFIVATSLLINKKNLKKIINKREGKKIFFIFFITYSLISYIINL